MERVKLVVKERKEPGSRVTKRLRTQGVIPGVLYAAGKPAVPIAIEAQALRIAMAGEAGRHAVLDVVFEGRKRGHVAMVQELQFDPVRHVISHVDLHEVHLNEPIERKVGLRLEGTAVGVKAGGLLSLVLHEVSVRGLPDDIPEHVTMDISGVELGEVVRVKDLTVPKELTLLDDPEETLFHIVPPRGVEVEEVVEAEEAAPAEPQAVSEEEGAES